YDSAMEVAFFVTRGRIEASSARHAARRGGVIARVRFELGPDLQQDGQDLCARPQGLIRSGGRRLLGPLEPDPSQAERLETNTSMPHMKARPAFGPGEPRVRIPVKRFLACPSLSLTAQITRGCLAPSAIWGCGVDRCGSILSHNRKLVH